MIKKIRYNISIFLTWFNFVVLRKKISKESFDLLCNYKATDREIKLINKIKKINETNW